jgi:Lon protease-like protein
VTVEIPLFPLNTVLFPGGPLQLRIFEQRYLDMISRCAQQQTSFGVVAIKEGAEVGAATTFAVGTLAQIVDFDREPDGLLGITAAGGGSFAVEQVSRKPDGLYVGEVTLWEPDVVTPLPAAHGQLAELTRTLLPLDVRYRGMPTAYEDAAWVGYRLAELLPLPLGAKQKLLETRDALARLDYLLATVLRLESGERE